MELTQLGPYRLLERIGKGGMGAVFLASYQGAGPAEGTRVAVKALSPQLAQAEGFRDRFEAEIESLKKLKHDGIVRLFGYGEQDGVLFYSMELVEGTSLEQEIHSGRRFTWRETLLIGIQVCRALKHAHDHGVVHRDIKPANLLLTKDNHIKIADFGIARLFGSTQLTTAGGVLGTADYMSPEQADGRAVTDKCDQYSLGGVLYALLAGRPPFQASTMPEMLQLQRFAEPDPVSRYAPKVPEQLEKLINQLLSKDPEDRFPNVLVLSRHMEAMEKALSRGEQSSSPPAATGLTSSPASDVTGSPVVTLNQQDASRDAALYDAPTLAQPDASQSPSDAQFSPATSTAAATRFTTVDDETRRLQHQEHGEGHLTLLVRWLALLVLVGGLGWVGWRLTRPATADGLYRTIVETIAEQGTDNLRPVADEIEQFLDRFPTDPRSAEIAGYHEQFQLQKAERRALARSRVTSASKLGTIENLYLEARAMSESDPARGRRMLSDLLVLFDPENLTAEGSEPNAANGSLSTDERRWLALARQRLAETRREAEQLAANHLPKLQAQLAQAAALAARNPALASEMYRAFIRLYGDELWAQHLVQRAQQELDQLSAVASP